MCGIAGSINCPSDNRTLSCIAHRGPDHQALLHLKAGQSDVFLAHTRLAILDLSEAGNQPMFTECGQYCIIFNGEIYNHLELRAKISGVTYKGHSDTETILYYIRQFGIDAVKDFNGIFAFALLDLRKQKIYLVRDHFGIKPLYYFQEGNKMVFGSELKVILHNPAYRKNIDINAVNTFLTFRYSPSPQTLFDNIKKLEPAHYLEFDLKGKIRLCNYWVSTPSTNHRISEEDAVAEYKRLLEQAVKRQLLSDVPVGLLLSGGIDSAVLGSLMARHVDRPIHTFTVGFHGQGDFNELADAKETATLLKSEHYDVQIDKEIYLDFFLNSFYHTEEPIAEPTIPALYYVSKLAAKHVKVVMSGQGADEPMAGYKRYYGEKVLSEYKQVLSLVPAGLADTLFSSNSTLQRGFYASGFEDELDRFVAIYTLFTPSLKSKLYKREFQPLVEEDQSEFFSKSYGEAYQLKDSLSKLLFLDTRGMLPDNLLLFNDKLTMANSLENRVPFLDIELVNFIETLPINLKLRGRTGKYIHRKAAEDLIPKSIINRKKRGFSTPVDSWFKTDFADLLIETIGNSNSLSRIYFDDACIKNMLQQHRTKKRDYQKQLFILLSLELWYQNFYKKF
jgi:asparagine synthase (glutamine-hydrolysing)